MAWVTSGFVVFVLAASVFVPVPDAGSPTGAPMVAPAFDDVQSIRATLALPRATALNDANGNRVFDTLERRFLANPLGEESIIVTFREGVDFDAALQAAKARLARAPDFVYPQLLGFAASASSTEAFAVAALPGVRQVEWAQPGQPDLDTATVNFGVRAVQEQLNITGSLDGLVDKLSLADIGVAILDTGMDGTHVDLAGRFVAFVDAEDGKIKEPFDSGDHGTHVASIVGGAGVGDPRMRGVAPGAALIGIKISNPSGSKQGALFGMDWIINHSAHYNIRISTISFGFGTTVDGTDALELAMDRAFEAGILPFKSAGNSGSEAGTITIPGGARGIVAVGSMLDPGGESLAGLPVNVGAIEPFIPTSEYGFHLSGYSSRGPTQDGRIKPDLVAPGQSIMAASNGTKDQYVAFSGTSMASPFAAGTAALVLAADPLLSPAQVRHVLTSTTDDWGPEGPDIDYGAGRLNALLAVQTALRDRLLRDGAPYEDLAKVQQASAPKIPFHEGGVLTGTTPVHTFTVADTALPLAITAIVNETLPIPGAPGGLPAQPPSVPVRRAFVLAVQGPADPAPVHLSPATARQTISTFIPTSSGTHTIRLVNPQPDARVIYDISAGLPPPTDIVVLEIPQAGEYEVVGRGELGPQTVPAPAFLATLALLGVAALVAARRR